MGKRMDLVGRRFNRLVVQEFVGKDKNRGLKWNCLCDCGKEKVVLADNLRSGTTQSCGCLQKERASNAQTKHGNCKNKRASKIYSVWQNMKDRCYNSAHKYYKHYGGRGIIVCPEWLESFENFYKDVGDIPDGMTFDRSNNNGNYEPGNWRFATQKEQNNNTRVNKPIRYKELVHTASEWISILNLQITRRALLRRLNYGWSEERAIETPVNKHNQKYKEI
jgi:hypothetical protein